MPVDRKLALEYLRKIDPPLYEIYDGLRRSGLDAEMLERKKDALGKLALYYDFLREVDAAEDRGILEVLNDYENEQVVLRNSNGGLIGL